MARSHAKARFTDPMLLLRTDRLPEGATWQYEILMDIGRLLSSPGAEFSFGPATTRNLAACTRRL
jgi:hypothetical protein